MAASPENPKDNPREVFGEKPAPGPRVPLNDKRKELNRELALRRAVYPKQVEVARMSQAQADRQIALLEAIAADYAIEPWPQTRALVTHWRPLAETVTVLGIHAARMHRDELLAVLAFAVACLRDAGIVGPTKEAPK